VDPTDDRLVIGIVSRLARYVLDLDRERDPIAECLEHGRKPRDALTIPRVEAVERRGRELVHHASPVGGAIDRRVVDHDRNSVRGQPDVEFDDTGAEPHRLVERRDRVLGSRDGCAAMSHDVRESIGRERPAAHRRGHGRSPSRGFSTGGPAPPARRTRARVRHERISERRTTSEMRTTHECTAV
jgi:hypothetical protein